MNKSEFYFDLPKELIAQVPLVDRSSSRLMVLDKDKQTITHKHFTDIVDYFRPTDILVRNNTKVIPARLFGTKEVTNAHVELLLLKQEGDVWECLAGNAKVVKVGSIISFGDGRLKAECLEVKDKGIRIMKMIYSGIFYEILQSLGTMPLPPYIKEKLEDPNRYQTVYAEVVGSSAAPTAGLHFTQDIFDQLIAKGVTIVDVTLHVGLGTFKPMDADDIHDHVMHSEFYQMSQETADILNEAKKQHHRIISIGTTSTRTLEAIMEKHGKFVACNDSTDIFIYPGKTFKAIDGLITNFHLPESTLIMLVSALATKEFVLNAYQVAIEEKYRFFSFGDAMLIL